MKGMFQQRGGIESIRVGWGIVFRGQVLFIRRRRRCLVGKRIFRRFCGQGGFGFFFGLVLVFGRRQFSYEGFRFSLEVIRTFEGSFGQRFCFQFRVQFLELYFSFFAVFSVALRFRFLGVEVVVGVSRFSIGYIQGQSQYQVRDLDFGVFRVGQLVFCFSVRSGVGRWLGILGFII